MPGRRKKTTGGIPVQKDQKGITGRRKGLKTDKEVLGNIHLPPEIHEHIFTKLDTEDKTTFSGALTSWHELVTKERPGFLCQKVAPILIEHLPREALQQFRTLSRSWTQALDHHYQEHPAHVRLPFEIANCRKNRIPMLINRFSSTDAILKFLDAMRKHPGNPFPGRNVELIVPYGSPWVKMEFWNNAFQLLLMFGKHVYYVQLSRFRFGPCFCKCLIQLPNLKGLVFDESDNSRDLPIRTDISLPRLRNLEMLEIGYRSLAVAQVILNSCPIPKNMKRLSINQIRCIGIPEVVHRFINLKVLQGPFDILDIQRFGNLARPPPFKEIEVSFNSQTEAHRVFRALEPFANTLINFKSWRLTSHDHLTWTNTDINLPNLRKLDLGEFTGSLDPFIKLTSLTDLTVACPYSQNYVEGTQVEFYGFQKPLKDSNIWKLIPSLNKLTVGNAVHYRPLPPKQNRRSKRKCVINNTKKYF